MTPATLKTLREALGLPVPWLAAQAGVRERTVNYWESGRNAVPDDVADMIQALWAHTQAAVTGVLQQLDELIEQHGQPAGPVRLVRYRTDADLHHYRPEFAGLPTTHHGALIARVIAEAPCDCEAVWLDRDAYESWLRTNNKADGEMSRSEFVSLT